MNTSYTGARASAQDSASSKRDNFTSDQFDWLRQVANDGGLSSTASRVAIALTKYFNREYEGWAWMAQATLARDLGITERAVRSALADLVQRGHLVTKRRGKRATNLYRLALNSESDRREFSDHDRKKNSGHDRKEFSDHPTVTGTIPRSDRNESSGVTGTNLPPNPLNEPIEGRESPQPGLGGEDSGRRTSENDADFEQWWQQVPRKVGKAAAAKLYRRIVERREATVEMLTAGILRYAAEVANREERYIAHPSTWLSQGRWNDEPAKKVGTTIDTDGNPVMPPPDRPQRAASRGWMEVAMDGLNRGRP